MAVTERSRILARNGLTGGDDDDGDNGGDLRMQCVDWFAEDESGRSGEVDDSDSDSDGDSDAEETAQPEFTIRAFGVTRTGRAVHLRISGFRPYFYVSVPDDVNGAHAVMYMKQLMRQIGRVADVVCVEAVPLFDFWGFKHEDKSQFVRLSFRSLRGMKVTASIISKMPQPEDWRRAPTKFRNPNPNPDGGGVRTMRVYESNIDPILRFFHLTEVSPSGWVRVARSRCTRSTSGGSAGGSGGEGVIECEWPAVERLQNEDTAPMLVASFDIECNSSHGDFPIANKDYRKLALDIMDMWSFGSISGSTEAVFARGLKQLSIPEYSVKEILKQGMLSAFFPAAQQTPRAAISKIRECNNACFKFNPLYLDAEADAAKVTPIINRVVDDVYDSLTHRDSANGGDDDVMGAVLSILNRSFKKWGVRGDEVIQIGTTVHVLGAQRYHKFVYVLGSCDAFEDDDGNPVTIRSFDDEASMLLEWVKLIRGIDPDVIVGYNIFGFDFEYLENRATALLSDYTKRVAFNVLGRHGPSDLVVKELSSSAMGNNVLKYIDTRGRVLIDLMKVVQRDHRLDSYKLDNVAKHFIGLQKDDVSPKEIFSLQRGSSADRSVIAKYCSQDCTLCNKLLSKLQIIPNNMGMSNVCSVPLSYIFMRGQGIKIFSLVARQCLDDGFAIPVLSRYVPSLGADDGYEGAIVLEPEVGMFLDTPVTVLDYNSLYPSSMISENISHDTLVMDKRYDNLPGVEYVDITYDDNERGRVTCRYAQSRCGILPRILKGLLRMRKATRDRMQNMRARPTEPTDLGGDDGFVVGAYCEKTGTIRGVRVDAATLASDTDPFQRAVLDGLQLAYKVTANSLYGQMGARTSQLYLKHIAACTTAVGRGMITKAKQFIEERHGGRVVYGDTDSLFVVFDKDLASSIKKAQEVSRTFRTVLKPPHNLEYEKTMFPLILLSKKRYVGLTYGDDPGAAPTQKSMGIVLKRRDNANIVKKIYGGMIDIILTQRDVPKAATFLTDSLRRLALSECDVDDLVISKTLKSEYKLPQQIAHWVLSRRMFERDPGSAPQVNDRVPYVFVETTKKNPLMGDRIEHVDFVKGNPARVRIDTRTYIENQLMKPCIQLLSIALEKLPGYVYREELSGRSALRSIAAAKQCDDEKAKERLASMREKAVQKLIFDPIFAMPVFRERCNRMSGQREITTFFKRL